jgi:hypothetical protein
MVPRQPEDRPSGRPPLVDEQLADELLGKAQAEGVELLGPAGLLSQVTKAVLERALAEEMTGHLGYEKHDPAGPAGDRNPRRRRRGACRVALLCGPEEQVLVLHSGTLTRRELGVAGVE